MDYSDLTKPLMDEGGLDDLVNTSTQATPTPTPKQRRKRRVEKLLVTLAILAGLAGAFMLLGPSGRIPLMDANRTLLAESPAEGFCAASAHFRSWDQANYDECVLNSSLDKEPLISSVINAFCMGVLEEGWPGSMDQCKQVAEGDRLWPTKERTPRGWLTNSWNAAFPYPGSLVGMGSRSSDNSRTGERDGNLRDGEAIR